MRDLLLLPLWLLRAASRERRALVLENLLLRHQVAVLTRPTRRRPRVRFGCMDKLLWVLVGRLRGYEYTVAWRTCHPACVTAGRRGKVFNADRAQ